MNVLLWKLKRSGRDIAQVKAFVPAIEQNKVIQRTLSGEVYVQTIGRGVRSASVTIFVTREELSLVNEAEADGALVSLVYRDTIYHGIIEAAVEWSAVVPGVWYDGQFRLLIEQSNKYVEELIE